MESTLTESLLVGIATGLVSDLIASFVFWLYVTHGVSPKLTLSKDISKLPTDNRKSGVYYQFKFANTAWRTPAIDVQIRATIYYPDFPRQGTTNSYRITTDTTELMELEAFPRMGRTSRRVAFNLDGENLCKKHQKSFFPEHIQVQANSGTLTLEELLKGARLYSRRMWTIEPVFGNICRNKGLDEFGLRGTEKVTGQWRLFGTVHNVEKLWRYGPEAKAV